MDLGLIFLKFAQVIGSGLGLPLVSTQSAHNLMRTEFGFSTSTTSELVPVLGTLSINFFRLTIGMITLF